MIIYVDILFINNTLMTFAIIWAVSRILDLNCKWWRLFLAALLGTFYTLLVIYLREYGLNICWQVLLNIFTAIIMVYTAFGCLRPKKFISALGYIYFISFLAIGSILSIIHITGLSLNSLARPLIFLSLGLIFIIIISKTGWKIFHEYSLPGELYLPVKVIYRDKEVEVTGLLDTGNSLNDPLTGRPVIIVEYKNILKLFPEQLSKDIIQKERGLLELIDIFSSYELGDRIRILPFSDLGQEHGMLIGFRPDKIEIIRDNNIFNTGHVLLALTDHKLDEEGNYQALINPQIFVENREADSDY